MEAGSHHSGGVVRGLRRPGRAGSGKLTGERLLPLLDRGPPPPSLSVLMDWPGKALTNQPSLQQISSQLLPVLTQLACSLSRSAEPDLRTPSALPPFPSLPTHSSQTLGVCVGGGEEQSQETGMAQGCPPRSLAKASHCCLEKHPGVGAGVGVWLWLLAQASCELTFR